MGGLARGSSEIVNVGGSWSPRGGDLPGHVHLLGLALALQHADAGGVDALVGLNGAANQQVIAELEGRPA